MADKDDNPTGENENPEGENENENEEEESEDDDSDDSSDDKGKKEDDSELVSLKRKYARRDRELRKAQQELAEFRKKNDKEGEPDPVTVANERLVRASARTVLASSGVTDKEDQKAVLAVLNLSDVEVDEDGPDEDLIQERIDELKRILGGTVKQRSRVPGTVRTRDSNGGKETNSDPDKARYRRIMGAR